MLGARNIRNHRAPARRNDDAIGFSDNVVIGEHERLFGVDDDA